MAFLASAGMWLFTKVQPYLLYIALGIAILGVVLVVLGKAKSLGRAEERVKSLERTIEAVKQRKRIERETNEALRRDGVSANDRLRDKWQRD